MTEYERRILLTALRSAARQMGRTPLVSEFEQALKEQVTTLLRDDALLSYGDPHLLGDLGLEIRVEATLQEMGLKVITGRAGLEDRVIPPPAGVRLKRPLVLEIKSGKSITVGRDALRQLDEWVFDLSGEEAIRKGGRAYSNVDALALATRGRLSTPRVTAHPTPHKGVLLYNWINNTRFCDRPSCLNGNDGEFVKKRDLCIVPFGTLLQLADAVREEDLAVADLWERIHNTCGVLEYLR